MKYTFFVILLLSIFQHRSLAQEGYELGLWLGAAQYFGDLNTNNRIASPGFAAGALVRRNFNERVCLSGHIAYGNISAADSTSTNSFQLKRNLSFRSKVWDFSGQIEFNFFPYIHGSYDQYFTPYIFAGIGVSKFNPQARLGNEWYDLRDFGTEGQNNGDEYLTTAFTLAYGMGFKVDINKTYSLNFTLSGRRVLSDYVDDVSQQYPDMNDLRSQRGEIAAQLSDRSNDPDFAREGFQRGNQKDSDYYYFASISFVRYFGHIKCPTISRIQE